MSRPANACPASGSKRLAATAQAARRRIGSAGMIQDRPVIVVDASSAQPADTPENQPRYPQPSTQKRGCGFPLLKLAALFCLQSGAVLQVVMDNLHNHDLRLFRQLWDRLKKDDILLGDRAFGEWIWRASVSSGPWMPCANTAPPWPRPATGKCAVNSGMTCCVTSPGIWSRHAPDGRNRARLNAAPNRIHYSTAPAICSWKFPIAVNIGKTAPGIYTPLTKCHSGLAPSLTQSAHNQIISK